MPVLTSSPATSQGSFFFMPKTLLLGFATHDSLITRTRIDAPQRIFRGIDVATERSRIGGALFRSEVFEQVLAVEGVETVRGMRADGRPAPVALDALEGEYRLYLPGLIVGGTVAET